MKCTGPDCPEEPVVHIVEIRNRQFVPQVDLCETHAASHLPFSETGGGKTSLGTGLSDQVNRFELRFVVFFDNSEGDGVYLWEVAGTKRFSIPVRRYEAWSILQALQKTIATRPLTFTAFSMTIHSLGGKLEEVIVEELDGSGGFYHAKLKLRQQDNRQVVVDVRPSDAFALAIACEVPILIADRVLARAAELGWTQGSSQAS